MKRYDMDGKEVSLGVLCIMEPEWAAKRIEALEAALSKLRRCGTCRHWFYQYGTCHKTGSTNFDRRHTCDKWEMDEE